MPVQVLANPAQISRHVQLAKLDIHFFLTEHAAQYALQIANLAQLQILVTPAIRVVQILVDYVLYAQAIVNHAQVRRYVQLAILDIHFLLTEHAVPSVCQIANLVQLQILVTSAIQVFRILVESVLRVQVIVNHAQVPLYVQLATPTIQFLLTEPAPQSAYQIANFA